MKFPLVRRSKLSVERDGFRSKVERLAAQNTMLKGKLGDAVRRGALREPTPPTYYVSRAEGIAYLQIPKAGCSTFISQILRLEDPAGYESRIAEFRRCVFGIHHSAAMAALRAGEAAGLLRFTFTRHPFARLWSFFQNQIAGQSGDPKCDATIAAEIAASGFAPGMAFADFIKALLEDKRARKNPHVRRQSDFLWSASGPNFDYIGQLERLADHRVFLRKVLGIAGDQLPSLNQTQSAGREARDAWAAIDPKHIEALSAYYAADFALLGYDHPDSGRRR
ncbi:MAG: sulfotransferase family protein [Verrucomicrobiales bacterium]